ncbi:uncharacterized protein LOC133199313 [Saccostrea echinata]|uniref:uncharacterized protein LOC133199313 n=1 Tax=Saccostrea echinata TaxID=191078 RepID=UPI002A7F93AB|nr:uncharacterized protein LOC133199313 [Saccostrea echinata]
MTLVTVLGILIVRKITLFLRKEAVSGYTYTQTSTAALRHPVRQWSNIPVHIVEEHHEVLPYWFRAADHGRISKGVTLVHIDGHSDMASNFYLDGYPFFKWPKNPQNINIMMQRNDGFITAAAMAGLIGNVVWIWPKWDQVNHNDSKTSGTLQFGWTITRQSKVGTDKAFCMCLTESIQQQKSCMFTSADETDMEVLMEEDACIIKRSIHYTEMREDLAREYLQSTHESFDNMILDIDEDFFGCEYASQPLYDLSVDLNALDTYLFQLFCPLHQTGEAVLDRYLAEVIDFVKRTKCISENKPENCDGKTISNTKQFFLRKRSIWRPYICKTTKKERSSFIDGIIEELFKLNLKQLHAVQKVGFCLSTTRKTYQPISPSLFSICKGANSPNETAVTEHRTNPIEVSTRGQLLSSILNVFKESPPKIITVCRSVRDGYTPRQHFVQIENIILNSIRKNYRKAFIHYDKGLLGGKNGFKQSNF